jgi:sulfite exporter TauE/SafE
MGPEIWAGFIVGILGSVHCMGMCGPIVVALPGGFGRGTRLVVSRLLYSSGRVVTYILMGTLVGLIGKSIVLAGFQRWLSVAAGIGIILAVLLPANITQKIFPAKFNYLVVERIKKAWGSLFQRRTMTSMFAIGLLNGLLPCGFLYAGLAAAATTGSAAGAGVYMAMFGLGTVPALLATSLFGPLLNLRVRQFFLRLLPVGAVVLGLLLVLRGMNLGIPYISPKLDTETHSCCH